MRATRSSLGRPVLSGLTCLAATLIVLTSPELTPPASAQTVQFEHASVYTDEASGYAILNVTISEAPASQVSVRYETFDVSTTGGDDYTVTSGPVSWAAGDATSKEIAIGIFNDEEPEGDERFGVRLVIPIGVIIGDPDTTFVTIVANDQSEAFFDVGQGFPNDSGEYVLFGLLDDQVTLTVRLRDFPTEPTTIDFTSDFTPASGSLEFDGVQEQQLVLGTPAVGPDEGFFTGHVELAQPSASRGPSPETIALITSRPDAAWLLSTCLACFFQALHYLADYDFCPEDCVQIGFCQNARTGGGGVSDDIATLRRYRDEILDATTVGQYYIARYDEHSEAAGIAMLRRPAFMFQVMRAVPDWLAGLGALVDGHGADVTVTLSMQNDLLGILDVLEAEGSASLASFIQFERQRLELDTIAGLTMIAFQSQIETLGGTPVSNTSWGAIKSRYR